MQRPKYALLPQEQMEIQISQVDLLRGTYPGDDEMLVDSTTTEHLDILRDWAMGNENGNAQTMINVPSVLVLELNIDVTVGSEGNYFPTSVRGATDMVQFSISVPVRVEKETADNVAAVRNASDDEGLPPPIHVRLRQPNWMSRIETAKINDNLASNCGYDDPVGQIEYIRNLVSESLGQFLTTSTLATTSSENQHSTNSGATALSSFQANEPIFRVWFYFPSLSTRSKRDDLVQYAPTYTLTGFVLAGKPGILCLEGTAPNVDAYMRYIKTESWGDIPSHHKKVSERYREVITERLFSGMQEITDSEWMGEKRGERGNRSDMKALEAWLDASGLKGTLQKVLM